MRREQNPELTRMGSAGGACAVGRIHFLGLLVHGLRKAACFHHARTCRHLAWGFPSFPVHSKPPPSADIPTHSPGPFSPDFQKETYAHSNPAARSKLLTAAGRMIAKLHDAGVVHGDLTTSNILLRAGTDELVCG